MREKTVRYSTRLAGLGAEQDARARWQAAIEALPEVVGGEDVCGVAVTAQAPTLVCVDANGEPLGTALTWIDRRAREESEELAEACEPTRNPPDPYFATAKLLWLVRNRPEEIERARAILCANSFTAQRLIGEFTFDETTAGLFQGWEGSFDPALSPLVPLELLPEPRPSMKIAGEVSPAGAAILAGMATGLWSDEKSAKALVGEEGTRFEPDTQLHMEYAKRLQLYRELQGMLAPITRALQLPERVGSLEQGAGHMSDDEPRRHT